MGIRGARWTTAAGLVIAAVAVALALESVSAQTRYMYLRGQHINPAYEGWWPNEDGSFKLFFGYYNGNWEEEFDVPVGAANSIEPGGPDQGQPTHFYPQRNPFLFTIDVPRDFGARELIWTLTSRGQTERAYASLKSDYRIDPQVISTEVGGDNGSLRDELRTNIPPTLTVEGMKQRSARVGQPLEMAAHAVDPDNIPARRRRAQEAPSLSTELLYRPMASVVASSGAGLRMSWIVYRGPAAAVSFDPVQMKTWTDTRAYGNSPWSPPWIIPEAPKDNRWVARATFSQPGTYILRAVVSDGGLFTYDNVTVTVTP